MGHQAQQQQQPGMSMNHHMSGQMGAHPMLQSHQMSNFAQNQALAGPPPPFNYHPTPHHHHTQYVPGASTTASMTPAMPQIQHQQYMNDQLIHSATNNLIKPIQSDFVMPQHQPVHFQHSMPHTSPAPPPIIINSNNNSTSSSSTTPNAVQHHQMSSSSPSGLLTNTKPLTPTNGHQANAAAGSSSSASSVVNMPSLASSKSIDSTGSSSNLLAAAFHSYVLFPSDHAFSADSSNGSASTPASAPNDPTNTAQQTVKQTVNQVDDSNVSNSGSGDQVLDAGVINQSSGGPTQATASSFYQIEDVLAKLIR